jgi:uncharacterized protein (TIGR02996 family)
VLDHLLQAVVDDPRAEDRWLVLADWLEENDDPRRAELLRLHRRLLATCCEPARHPERAAWQERIVALLAEGVRPCVPRRTVFLGKRKLPLTFAWIPPGSFLMGSPPEEEGRRENEILHRVTLNRGFWLGVYPVTQAQWWWAMKRKPSQFQGNDRPVERVSWDDCHWLCRRLAEKAALPFRLPSEPEWEWACRAGTTTPFHFGQTISTQQANYDGGRVYGPGKKGVYRQQTTPVGSFPPNAWGLFDMHGNVEEWCVNNPREGDNQVFRGGSWILSPLYCRSAFRRDAVPTSRYYFVGCRLVLWDWRHPSKEDR